jgi:hypothetical protein
MSTASRRSECCDGANAILALDREVDAGGEVDAGAAQERAASATAK